MAALFRIDTRDEIVTDASAGGRTDFKNASRTQRDGLEISAEWPLGARVRGKHVPTPGSTRASPTGSPRARRRSPCGRREAARAFRGRSLSAELVWRHAASGFHAAAELRASSKVYVNEANTDAAAGYAVTSLRAGFEQGRDAVALPGVRARG